MPTQILQHARPRASEDSEDHVTMIEGDLDMLIREIEAGWAAAEYARLEAEAQEMLESLMTEDGEVVRSRRSP